MSVTAPLDAAVTETATQTPLTEENAVRFDKNGLTFSREVTIGEWTDTGRRLKQIEGAIQWWIGDWLNYGENAYGDKYTEAIKAT